MSDIRGSRALCFASIVALASSASFVTAASFVARRLCATGSCWFLDTAARGRRTGAIVMIGLGEL